MLLLVVEMLWIMMQNGKASHALLHPNGHRSLVVLAPLFQSAGSYKYEPDAFENVHDIPSLEQRAPKAHMLTIFWVRHNLVGRGAVREDAEDAEDEHLTAGEEVRESGRPVHEADCSGSLQDTKGDKDTDDHLL